MVQQDAATGSQPVVLVIDQQRLRGAGFVGLLHGWAAANGVGLRAMQPGQAASLPRGEVRRLVIFCTGAASLREPPAAAWLQEALALAAGVPVAILSDSDEVEEVVAALRAGARGYLPTSTEPAVALQALSYMLAGGSFFPPTALLKRHRPRAIRLPPNGEPFDGSRLARGRLAGRDLVVLTHLRAGLSNKAIAHLLGTQESAVKAQLRQIMRKLRVANRTQAALAAPILAEGILAEGGALPEGR
jgi:DNA-binding NarL/FixJ family response regulator